jgi:heptosyltransferase II
MKRALIVKLGAIGDVIMTVPAIALLHEQGYSIDWVCGPAVADLLRCYSWINVIVADDDAILQGSIAQRVRALAALWKQLVQTHYDLSATLYYDTRWRILTLPVRASRSLTLSKTDRTRRIVPTRHHSNEFARILLGWPDTCRETNLPPLRPDRLPVAPIPPRTAARRIAMVPGGASNMVRQQTLRRWPSDRYATLAAKLILERDWDVVLLGGPGDTWVRQDFKGIANHPNLTDLIGATKLSELITMADTCDLVLSHDTGPLHLAGLSRAPLLALFGPTDPSSFLPRRANVRVLWGGAGFACRPCYDGRDFAPCESNGCMQSIAIETVLATIDEMLGTTRIESHALVGVSL